MARSLENGFVHKRTRAVAFSSLSGKALCSRPDMIVRASYDGSRNLRRGLVWIWFRD